ncbi:MAG: hypothetical protein RL760_154 [Candidatus Eisenbacteria bacterium]
MKRIVTTLALLALCASTSFAANALRISQVYGGGGGSTGTYLRDYVEIFNSSSSDIDISGYALEYGSATGNWGSATTNYFVFPAGAKVKACSYLLIECGATGTAGGTLPVTADYVTTAISASATNGKMALFTALNSNIVCGSETGLLDKVAYGTGTCAEGTAVGALNATNVAVRNNGGLTDTDANNSDFTITATSSTTPRNSASAINPGCTVVPTRKSNWGAVKAIYR